jgi:hypothetical protein
MKKKYHFILSLSIAGFDLALSDVCREKEKNSVCEHQKLLIHIFSILCYDMN